MTSNLYDRIRQFYDTSSNLWEEMWGEHMHHGYYGPEGNRPKERRQAQIDTIEELLRWTQTCQGENFSLRTDRPGQQILDIGCGIGGSTLYLAEKFSTKAIGITLSPVQANRATERAAEARIAGEAGFLVADALNVPFADESFDLVWSLESGEHMPDKAGFLRECYRLLKPGGTLILATWCHRPTDAPAGPLTAAERQHLADIYRVYHLPYVISLPEYEAIAREIEFQNIQTADWSKAVAPFWNDVIESALNPTAVFGVLMAGWDTIQGALSMGLMRDGYASGLVRFGVLCAVK
ncbi:MAG: methyltransferase domain-containing protein [Cyanobacteriota bacterium]|nr:methyltransferase domain-containing protein [Cyanobacteriota bacterium]